MSGMFLSAFVFLPIATSLRLKELETDLCAGSGASCNGNQCCGGFSGSNGLTFPCPNADDDFDGCQTNQKYNYTPDVLPSATCPGSCDTCTGDQCCPGFADSNNLTFPCPSAPDSYDMCDTNTRFSDSSACTPSASGDPHVVSVTGERFDLWKTGWSTFVQIPMDVPPNTVPQLVVTANVVPYGDDTCAPAFLQNVRMWGSMLDDHEVLVRAGPLDGEVPFGVSLDGTPFKHIDTVTDSEIFVGHSFLVTGLISDDEPGVWGPDAKLMLKVGALLVTVKQHTEGRLVDSRSMLDLSVDGLEAVDSVGGWLGVDGSLTAGRAPSECVEAVFIDDGARRANHDKSRSVGFQSPRAL